MGCNHYPTLLNETLPLARKKVPFSAKRFDEVLITINVWMLNVVV